MKFYEITIMEVEFSAFILWDFAYSDNESELVDILEDVYGGEPDRRGGARFGGGSWSRRIYGNSENRLEEEKDFESIRTIVESEVDGLLDITTFLVLSDDQIAEVVSSPNRTVRNRLRKEIESEFENLPTIVDHSETGVCGAYYVERKGGNPIITDASEVDPERVAKILNEDRNKLYPFGFQTSGPKSLLRGNHFVNPTGSMEPYDGLCVVRRDVHEESGPLGKLILDPAWYSEFSILKKYYRLQRWADSRWEMLHKFDDRSDKSREALASLPEEIIDVTNVLQPSDEIHQLQTDFVDFRTRYDAELDSLHSEFDERADEAESQFGNQYDIPIPSPKANQILQQKEPQSLLGYFEDNTEHTFEQLESLRERVTKKIDSIIASIQGRTRLEATRENIQLQQRVTTLTWLLTFLTVVLVFLTIFLVVLELI